MHIPLLQGKEKKQQNQAAFLNDDVTCMDLDQQGQT